jgi:hypothetical protein
MKKVWKSSHPDLLMCDISRLLSVPFPIFPASFPFATTNSGLPESDGKLGRKKGALSGFFGALIGLFRICHQETQKIVNDLFWQPLCAGHGSQALDIDVPLSISLHGGNGKKCRF